jgi:uncharacterized protein YciI
MKTAPVKITLVLMALTIFGACKKNEPAAIPDTQNEMATEVSKDFDSIKAKAYGADDYGMKKYVMAFLKRGPNKSADSIQRSELQRAHLDNITRLAEEGKLVLAGPFFGNDDLRGIYVFNVPSIEEAEALTNSDPSIQAGVLVMELKEWYGSAALMEINELHHSLAKKDI